MSEMRVEHDSLGEVKVPCSCYYGVHTARALTNFAIAGPASARTPSWSVRSPPSSRRVRLPTASSGSCRLTAWSPSERQRGDREQGTRADGSSAGGLRPPAPHRPCERVRARTTCTRRPPSRPCTSPSANSSWPWRCCGTPSQGRRVREHRQDRSDPAPGRRSHDAGTRVRRVRGDDGRGHRTSDGGPSPPPRDQPRRHRDRHRHHDGSPIRSVRVRPAVRTRERRTDHSASPH